MAYYGPAVGYPNPQLNPPPLAYATVPLVPAWQWTALSTGPLMPYQYPPANVMSVTPAYPPPNWNGAAPAAGIPQTIGASCSCCTALFQELSLAVGFTARKSSRIQFWYYARAIILSRHTGFIVL
ncbi:hypothetical protein CALCODRAFT_481517 [Calocera cornea HHB12733]|uniref:Uncharacterized protein n=1 Tax=Calocera cornea HHB12733 TaxID=1353952 RepID=A0A165HLK7_9BASI|nr:hypothetical protein CALCODRAFT_481517 [Calocera cornea HHB12733]